MTNQSHFIRLTPRAKKAQGDSAHQVDTGGKRARILVVEDDLHLMEGIKEILEMDDYDVITAPNGLEGLEALRQIKTTPDLIVSDIMMPKMDGYEFFESVRTESEWVTIPFIFLTAKGEKSDVRLGKAMGADDYVIKPFGAEDLLVAVTAKLERAKQISTIFSSQVSEMKRNILTILNHEFRTPLTYVVAYSDMLERDGPSMSPEEIKEFLTGVSAGADRLRRLVENFIYLVEIETGEAETAFGWRKKPFQDFDGVLRNAAKAYQPHLDKRNQELRITVEPGLPAIQGDFEYLTVAVARLLDNAIKFSDPSSVIEAAVYMDAEQRIALSVTDHGRGIPENEIGNIFDAFYQIDRQKFEDQGAGSGLAIVRGIADVHGAEISVESVEGEGSVFTLHFKPLGSG